MSLSTDIPRGTPPGPVERDPGILFTECSARWEVGGGTPGWEESSVWSGGKTEQTSGGSASNFLYFQYWAEPGEVGPTNNNRDTVPCCTVLYRELDPQHNPSLPWTMECPPFRSVWKITMEGKCFTSEKLSFNYPSSLSRSICWAPADQLKRLWRNVVQLPENFTFSKEFPES